MKKGKSNSKPCFKRNKKERKERASDREKVSETETRKCHLPSPKKVRGTVDKDGKRYC